MIAEGVEDELTLKRLAMLDCDLAQGYHVSRPLAADRFAEWISPPPPAAEPIVPRIHERAAATA